MEEAKVKVEIELPKDAVHVEGQEEDSKKKDADKETAYKPATDSEIAKLQKELEARRKRFEATAPIKPNSDGMAPLLDRLPGAQDSSPPNHHQKILVAAGLAIALAGLALWPLASLAAGITVAFIGVLIVTAGTFVKV